MSSSSRALQKQLYHHRQLYVLLILPLVYIIVFNYLPMLGISIAFTKYTPRTGLFGGDFIGLANFNKFIHSYQFKRVVPNTIRLSVYSLVAGFPMPILLALMLNSLRSEKWKRIIQNITYIPHFISTVVLVGMLMQLFNTRTGIYASLCNYFTNTAPRDLLGDPAVFSHLYVWSGIWQNMGWSAIIYIAALTGIDQQLHEAAVIDGASRWQRVLHIDLPGIIPTIIIMLIMRFGSVMTVGFEKVYLMQNNLNLASSEVISTYVYKVGLSESGGNFSYATAIDLFNSIINFTLLLIVNTISRKVGEMSLW